MFAELHFIKTYCNPQTVLTNFEVEICTLTYPSHIPTSSLSPIPIGYSLKIYPESTRSSSPLLPCCHKSPSFLTLCNRFSTGASVPSFALPLTCQMSALSLCCLKSLTSDLFTHNKVSSYKGFQYSADAVLT